MELMLEEPETAPVGSGALVSSERLDRAELQAGQELLGLGSLPGAQGPLDPEALAVGVLRVQLLLVGVQGVQQSGLATGGGSQRPEALLLHGRGAGRGGKGKAQRAERSGLCHGHGL